MTNEKIPPGYKKTDVGVIPEDWEVKNFDNILISIPTKDYQLQTTEYKNIGKYPIIDQGQKSIVGFSDREEKVFFDIQDGVIIFGDHTRIVKYYIRPFIVGADGVKIIKRKKEVVDLKYVYYYLNLHKIPETGYNRHFKFLKEMNFLLPPLPEQRAIVRVLSDVDKLIECLDKLIEKKKLIKKGAMQQLLTGKKRLPGFKGEWVKKKLGETGYCQSGNGFPLKYQNLKTGVYPFFKVADLSRKGNSIFLKFSNHWITEDIRRKIGAFVFPQNAIIFAKIGAAIFLERKRILFQNSCIDNNMMGFIIDSSQADYRFIYYIFNTLSLSRLVESTALPSISKNNIENLEISLPPSLEEQQVIAQILSDMDAEIEALEKKKEKYEMIKKGMMELLLTGKVRVKEENGKIRRLRV